MWLSPIPQKVSVSTDLLLTDGEHKDVLFFHQIGSRFGYHACHM